MRPWSRRSAPGAPGERLPGSRVHRKVRAQPEARKGRRSAARTRHAEADAGERAVGAGMRRGHSARRPKPQRIGSRLMCPTSCGALDATRFYTKADGWCWFFMAVDFTVSSDVVEMACGQEGDVPLGGPRAGPPGRADPYGGLTAAQDRARTPDYAMTWWSAVHGPTSSRPSSAMARDTVDRGAYDGLSPLSARRCSRSASDPHAQGGVPATSTDFDEPRGSQTSRSASSSNPTTRRVALRVGTPTGPRPQARRRSFTYARRHD